MVLLLTRFSKILFDKKLGQLFALKDATELFKHLPGELSKPLEETKSLTESLKLNQVFKKLVRVIKSLVKCFAL